MKKYILMVLLATASITFSSLLIRFSQIGPVASGAYRLLLAIPFLGLIDYYTPKQASIRFNRQVLIAALLGGIFFAMDLAVFNVALLYSTLAEATLLTNLVPFVLVPISVIFFKEKVSPQFLIPLMLAIIGLYLITHEKDLTTRHLLGDWLALLSAVFYALFLLCIKKARENYYTARVMSLVCLSGGIVLLLLAIYRHEIILARSAYAWLVLLGIVISGQITGQTLLAYAVKFIPVQLAAIFMLLSPIFAAVYAYIIFNEKLHPQQVSGIIIILIAVYYAKQILERGLKKDDF